MYQYTPEQLYQALAQPFADSDIEWRVSATSKDKTRGLAVPYVTNRAIQQRLDQTVGPENWKNDFKAWHRFGGKEGEVIGQLCGISIYFADRKEWICKWDGAENSDIEPIKGGLSDSMKRAAVQWAIGRYLYGMAQLNLWVSIDERKAIVYEERSKLDRAHADWVAKLKSRQVPVPQQPGSQPPQVQPQQQNPQAGPQQTGGQRTPQPQTARQPQPAIPQSQAPMGGPQAQAPQQGPAPAVPPAPPVQAAPQATQAPQPGEPAGQPLPPATYMVTGAVLRPAMTGGQNTSLQLRMDNGQIYQAFLMGVDPRLTVGVWIVNAVLVQKAKQGIVFFTLDTYEVYNQQAA